MQSETWHLSKHNVRNTRQTAGLRTRPMYKEFLPFRQRSITFSTGVASAATFCAFVLRRNVIV